MKNHAAVHRPVGKHDVWNRLRPAGHVVEASRQGSSTYRAPRALIARHAGVSIRTVTLANAELARAVLLVIEKHFDARRKQPKVSTYTLCSLRPRRPGNIRTTPRETKEADRLPGLNGIPLSRRVEFPKKKQRRRRQGRQAHSRPPLTRAGIALWLMATLGRSSIPGKPFSPDASRKAKLKQRGSSAGLAGCLRSARR